MYEDEVVLLQDQLLIHGLQRGLPGITYQLADCQVRQPGSSTTAARTNRHKDHVCNGWHVQGQTALFWVLS